MSITTPLSELATFVGKSEKNKKTSSDREAFWQAYGAVADGAEQRPVASRVTDLLGVVMTLSARTQRIVAPKAIIELDVFAPNGKRAVQIIMGENS